MIPCARFDDHTPGNERSFELRGLERTILARRTDEVLPALTELERAVAGGRWAGGYLAYEAAPAFDRERVVRSPRPGDPFAHLPLLWFGIFEHREEVEPFQPRPGPPPYRVSAWHAEIERDDYESAVATIRDRIAAGDTRQVNHTFRLRAAFSGEPYEFYRDLVLAQRGAHAATFDVGRYRVLSASPELFVRVVGNRIETRPMKGTIRRGRWLGEDDTLAARLLTSEKERTENLIIVDMLRADLERIAEPGSVDVDELLKLERYETLWHLTSTVSGRLRSGTGVAEIMTALFPAGSITGSPKPATMRIIRELERSPRGVYCGALGSVAPPDEGGGLEFSVGIRTVVIDGQEGVAEYGVGGAITWDSVPQSEYEEARLKAQLLVERRPDFDLVETIRWSPDTGFVLLEEHLTRLERSAGYFGFAWDPDLVVECVDKEVTGHEAARQVRVVVGRCGTVTASSAAITEPFVADPAAAPTITVTVAEDPVSSGDVFLFHATTHRDAYEARRDRHPGVDDVLLVNERGELTETTVGNLALRFGDRWWTPSVESGCLSGTYRQRLLDQGRLRERAIAVHELYAADEIAVVDGIRGWRRAVLAE